MSLSFRLHSRPQAFWSREQFRGRQFFLEDMDGLERAGVENGFGIVQAHYIYCALYSYYYYINSTSDHKALDPGGWGPLTHLIKKKKKKNPNTEIILPFMEVVLINKIHKANLCELCSSYFLELWHSFKLNSQILSNLIIFKT